jgi:hypothetical protein
MEMQKKGLRVQGIITIPADVPEPLAVKGLVMADMVGAELDTPDSTENGALAVLNATMLSALMKHRMNPMLPEPLPSKNLTWERQLPRPCLPQFVESLQNNQTIRYQLRSRISTSFCTATFPISPAEC